jgi:hypothetical protein
MYTDISETLKVSKRCLLSSLLIFITVFGNHYADAGKIKGNFLIKKTIDRLNNSKNATTKCIKYL